MENIMRFSSTVTFNKKKEKIMIQNYINHIVFVVDRSGSMEPLTDSVVRVFDDQVAYLARRSKEVNQETRVSVYLFDTTVECLIYDMDVMRLPSLRGCYHTGGGTALIDATIKAAEDLRKTPELYGDHAFLVYVLTDGEENSSSRYPSTLGVLISDLPENWTFAVMVPDQRGVHEAKKFGFPAENIAVWNVSQKGIQEIGKVITNSTDNFFINRARGIRGTKTLFKLDTSSLSTKIIKNTLEEVKDYVLINSPTTGQIREIVQIATMRPYVKGSAYYHLDKTETVQAYKQIAIKDKMSGRVYSGQNARILLGLPNNDIRVQPGDFGQYDIFVQSTSVNRKILAGSQVLVLK